MGLTGKWIWGKVEEGMTGDGGRGGLV